MIKKAKCEGCGKNGLTGWSACIEKQLCAACLGSITNTPASVIQRELEVKMVHKPDGSGFCTCWADTYICQVCGHELCGEHNPPAWRPDLTGHAVAGNICPACLKNKGG